ncbi:MAG: aminotransferase class IV [Candidatus Omnitrophica bacterium]|nr:aminotransferase class IV [Candidatus Omnitrophota bacterium]
MAKLARAPSRSVATTDRQHVQTQHAPGSVGAWDVARATRPRWPLPEPDTSSGCFETMRAYHGRIFRLSHHLERLSASANYLEIRIPLRPSDVAQRLEHALQRSGIQEAVVRIALLPDRHRVASPSIVVQPAQPIAPEIYARGINVAIVPTRKFPVSQIDPQAKFSARLGSVMAVLDAQLRHADEALFLDAMGCVTESTASNLGLIKGGVFLAPPCRLGLLAGVTWQALVEVAHELRLPYREMTLTRHELYNADEALMTSTLKEVLAVTRVDGRTIGTGAPGPITKQLHQAFRQLVRRELHHDALV